jgi:hypothetical protein
VGTRTLGADPRCNRLGRPINACKRPASPSGRRVPQKLLHEDSPASLAPRQQDGSHRSRLLARHVPAEGRRVLSLWSVSGCELLARLTRGFLFNAQPAEKPRDQIAHCASSFFVQDESSNELPLRRASGTAEEGVLGPRRLRRSTGRRRSIAGLKLTFRGRKRVACWHQQLRPSP